MRTQPLSYVLLATGQVDPIPSSVALTHPAPLRHRSADGYLPRFRRRHHRAQAGIAGFKPNQPARTPLS